MATPRAERRAARRVPAPRSARLVDISLGGVKLETSAPLVKDAIVDLLLRLDERVIPVAARVVRARRRRGSVVASLAFERVLESDRALLEEALVREVAERMTVVLREAVAPARPPARPRRAR